MTMNDWKELLKELAEVFPANPDRTVMGFEATREFFHVSLGSPITSYAVYYQLVNESFEQAKIEKTLELICQQRGWEFRTGMTWHLDKPICYAKVWIQTYKGESGDSVWTVEGKATAKPTRLEALALACIAAERGQNASA